MLLQSFASRLLQKSQQPTGSFEKGSLIECKAQLQGNTFSVMVLSSLLSGS
jgi:hypothetical protein